MVIGAHGICGNYCIGLLPWPLGRGNARMLFEFFYPCPKGQGNEGHGNEGTHEILVGFMLGNRYGDWCPRNLW